MPRANFTVKTDEVRQALEFYKKLIAFLPPDVAAWDDASNNKWLISGKGAMIMNPPSAWAVAKRDAPQVAEQCWTHGFPLGPKGRFAPFLPYFWSSLEFLQEQGSGKEPARALVAAVIDREAGRGERRLRPAGLCEADHVEDLGRGRAAEGYALPLPEPVQPSELSIAASPAPPKIAQQIYAQATLTKMCLRYAQGEAMEKTLAWAEGECEGFMRS